MEKVLAVVVTYNRLPLLRQALMGLWQQSTPCDILVVDNAGTDGTAEALRDWAAQGKLFFCRMETNTGGAGGFFHGICWAVRRGYDYVWLMDDDCFAEKTALEKLLQADRRLGGGAHYGFLSGTALWKDGTVCVMNRQKAAKLRFQSPELLEAGIQRVLQATFVSLLVPAAHFSRFGLPLRDYFLWNDDIEFTRRLAVRCRMPCYQVLDSRVVHQMAENCGSHIAKDSAERIDRYRLAYRNERHTYRQEGLSGCLYYMARCGRDALRILLMAGDHRRERFRALLTGIRQGKTFRPAVEYPEKGRDSDGDETA